jgi:hypothetical protein
MPIVIAPNPPPVTAPGATAADIVLQAGSVISARVLQILGPDQVRIAIGGQSIDVLSQVPLQAGQTLQLQVSQTASGIGLSIVNQQGTAGANPSVPGASTVTLAADAASLVAALATPITTTAGNQLTPFETLAVSLASQAAATQQTSLAPLFANLEATTGSPALSPQAQQAVTQVLSLQISLDQNLSGGDIKQGFEASGLFLEASLASGSLPASGAVPDLKAALIVLRQALAASLADVTVTAGASGAADTAQQGTAASAAPPGTVSTEGPTQGAATLPGIRTATGVPETASPSIPLTQVPQPSAQPSVSPLVIIAGAETGLIESPAIAPQPASDAPRLTTSARNAAPETAQEILDLVSSSQILNSISAPADAAARSAASSAALSLLQEALQAGPLGAGNPSRLALENGQALALIPALAGTRTSVIEEAEFWRTNLPPPPINGALPAAQPVAPVTLNPHAPQESTLQRLLENTDGAIARQTLLQVASLPGQTDAATRRIDPAVPRWNFEIPFATPSGTAIAQFEISRDGGGDTVEPAERVWRARFSLDVEPAGPVHALISLSGERTSVRMWAERPTTASQLRAGLSQLGQALSRADLQVGDIVVRDGAPRQRTSAPAGHFLDRAL